MKKVEPPTYEVKVIFIGDSGVGKTSLIQRMLKDTFNPSDPATVGFAFEIYQFCNSENVTYKLRIWDTAGQERFRAITANYIRGAAIVVFVYSINDKSSFENIKFWDNTVAAIAPECFKILLGNKCDNIKGGRVVEASDAKKLKEELGMDLFMETSAKNRDNVPKLLEMMRHYGEKAPAKVSRQSTSWDALEKDLAESKKPEDSSCC